MRKKAFQLFSLVIFIAALWLLHHELKAYHYREIVAQIRAIPLSQVIGAVILTILCYGVLTGYDFLGTRYARHPLRYRQIALPSFISYAVSNTMVNPLFSGAIRYRLYTALGLSTVEIAQVIAFCMVTFWLGFLTLGGLLLTIEPLTIPTSLSGPIMPVHSLGVLFLLVATIYLVGVLVHKQHITIGPWELTVPSPQMALLQLLVSWADWILVGSIVYVLLPPAARISYLQLLGAFLLAQVLGLLSQVPAGIGVFETLMVLLLKPTIPADVVLGVLLVYRVLYYLVPLIMAGIILAVRELRQQRAVVKHAGTLFQRWVSPVIPDILAVTTFLGGIILLVSGATPAEAGRLAWLEEILPLPVIEISHFLGSLAGVGLILLARGLQRRLDGAYFLTVSLLGTGILMSLLKGGDYEEALTLTAMLAALLPTRRQFYRKASLIEQRFTPGWVFAIVVVLASSTWLGFFAYKHVAYSHELWWQFSLHGNASRFLRATVGTIVAVMIFALMNLLRTAKPVSIPPTIENLDVIRQIVRESPKANAHLALLGDKHFLLNADHQAGIMYGIEGKSWIAMGDPIGQQIAHAELIWQFRELCDRHGGWPVFYEVGTDDLPLYIEQGLTLVKLGEEARIPLTTFSLDGSHHKGKRYTLRKLEKEGTTFEIVPSDAVSPLLPELRLISDDWLLKKNTTEKRFSLGSFDPAYLIQTPLVLVRHQDKIVAFANLWSGAQHAELSIDLMRYASDAPSDVMEYLFVQLLLWAKQEGYAWFNLGMAPLAGIENRPAAPLWNRMAALVYQHGEHFYNFQGLRQYKQKFDPVWTPKYLASPGGVALPLILANITALNSGSLKGVVSR
jgi:phosphatidylglycerol lysyltransferase